jgi:hypothetical protein
VLAHGLCRFQCSSCRCERLVGRNTQDNDGAFIRLEQNAGSARIFGFEEEITAAPVRGLPLNASAGYNNFKFTSLLANRSASMPWPPS